jgi:hypothetical protein
VREVATTPAMSPARTSTAVVETAEAAGTEAYSRRSSFSVSTLAHHCARKSSLIFTGS